MLVYLRDGSAQTIVRAATLRQKLKIKLSTTPSHSNSDTGPTSTSADPITPGAWQGSHGSANFEVTGMTQPRKNPVAKRDSNPGSSALEAYALTTRPTRRSQRTNRLGMRHLSQETCSVSQRNKTITDGNNSSVSELCWEGGHWHPIFLLPVFLAHHGFYREISRTWGRYHGGRRPSSDASLRSPTVIPPPALEKPSIMKRYHRRRTTR